MFLLVKLTLLVVVLEDLVQHVLSNADLKFFLVLPQLIYKVLLRDGLGILFFAFLVLLLRHDVLLENFTGEEARTLASHGLNPGYVLVGYFSWGQLA